MSKPIVTTITATKSKAIIKTEGFGRNAVWNIYTEDWQWHEAIAQAVANHHASAMGAMMPCPTLEPVLCAGCGGLHPKDPTNRWETSYCPTCAKEVTSPPSDAEALRDGSDGVDNKDTPRNQSSSLVD